jgi:hypothetical protein
MGRLGHRPARQGLGDSSSHLSSQPPARAHDWHRVFSHGAFLGRAVCRRHLQATGPSVFPVVPSRACSGDVQFRWATERLPIVGCHMCRRQFVGTPRLGTEVASCYIRLVGRASCTSALNLIAGFSPQDTCAHGCACNWWVHSWASCTLGKWLAWQAWAQSLACVHVQGFLLVRQAGPRGRF